MPDPAQQSPLHMRNPYPAAPNAYRPNAYVPASFFPTPKAKVSVLGLIGAVVVIISAFLPYAKVSAFGFSQGISLFQAGGKDIIFVFSAALLAILMSIRGVPAGLFAAGATTIGIGIMENLSIHNAMNVTGTTIDLSQYISLGAGCYLLYVGGALILIAGFIARK